MRLTPAPTRIAVAATLPLLVLLVAPRVAAAGEYSVAACQADSLSFSTRAFVDAAGQPDQVVAGEDHVHAAILPMARKLDWQVRHASMIASHLLRVFRYSSSASTAA